MRVSAGTLFVSLAAVWVVVVYAFHLMPPSTADKKKEFYKCVDEFSLAVPKSQALLVCRQKTGFDERL